MSLFQECEYCRLNSGCFLNETETKKCQEFCGSEYTPNAAQFTQRAYPDTELRSDYLLNQYGQVSYSQFIGKLRIYYQYATIMVERNAGYIMNELCKLHILMLYTI